ncbi:DNA translocase FtsK [Peloplasma aerotolerans]|uniref:DNA translocase FtsK n=1 Tax=Peloplasma aerotolerans TaxID=3044389 RepID=A0AAW6U947_9MOLU|nr:DNA translocase FtsK [Mariniplasma sp. M4Ah]MDI6452591.1 DNA translocase FtsK [Mariniplasma sp. M4Ah]
MRKQKENPQLNIEKEKFIIFQFVKLEGIRGKEKYKSDRFVSPIFGRSVKDVVTVPFTVKDTGDTTRRFDAFRTKAKLSEEEAKEKYGNKYYEFTNIVSNKTRTEYFGESNYVPTNEKEKEEVKERTIIKPIARNYREPVQKEQESPFKAYQEPKRVAHVPPVMNEKKIEQEPVVETYKRRAPIEAKDIVTSDFGSNQDLDDVLQDEVRKPQREIYKPKEESYIYPSIKIFSKKQRDLNDKPQWLLDQIDVINATFEQFGIEAEVTDSRKGPTVTRYEVSLDPGVNVKRISGIQDNLMMNLSSQSIRIEAPIPGKPYVGIEVPNVKTEIVAFGNVVDTKEFLEDMEHPLKVALGVDIDGQNIYVDIQAMPHGLIAGATNSGKSVCVNTVLVSLLLKNSPKDLKLILIDPKMVELTPYNDLPHLITPVITDVKMAAAALNWAVSEMEKRYQTFSQSRSRDIRSYNDNVKRGLIDSEKMPFIVVVIDELADLMAVAAHDVEESIQRLTQKARAAGIHLLVATQRPSTDVVKGTIKSNIPARIAFKVASFVDSTTILDGAGAEALLGKGDMLLKRSDRTHRLQGAFIPDEEIYAVTDFIREQYQPQYVFQHEALKQQAHMREVTSDDLFESVAYFVVQTGNASINNIQKEFTIGFNRAQKLVEMLEEYEIVSRHQGTKAREVLVTTMELKEILGQNE